jgi:hypothetical protein
MDDVTVPLWMEMEQIAWANRVRALHVCQECGAWITGDHDDPILKRCSTCTFRGFLGAVGSIVPVNDDEYEKGVLKIRTPWEATVRRWHAAILALPLIDHWLALMAPVEEAPTEGERQKCGGKLGAKTRYLILRRDGFKCQQCGRQTPEVVVEVDHKTPHSFSRNGSAGKCVLCTPANLWTLCRDCNRGKGNGYDDG